MHNTQENKNSRRIKIFNSAEIAARQVPLNTLRKLKISGLSLCLAHTKAGWFAIQDACPHQKASLSQGQLNSQNQVICPLHQYTYSLLNGAEGNCRTEACQVYEVVQEEGGLYLYL